MSSLTQYLPTYYPRVQTQWVVTEYGDYEEADSCVANTVSCMKEIFHYRRYGQVKYFSSYWIYGNRLPSHWQGSGMHYYEALAQVQTDGALITDKWRDNLPYHDFSQAGHSMKGAKSTVADEYVSMVGSARSNRIASWKKIPGESFDHNAVEDAVIANGAVMVSLALFNEFYKVGSSGVVPIWSEYNGVNHSMAIIGWKLINGVEHWICQNSWYSDWGDNGICYLHKWHYAIYDYWTAVNSTVPTPSTPAIGNVAISETNIAINLTSGLNTEYIQWDRSWVDNHGNSNDHEYPLASSSSYVQNFLPPPPGVYNLKVRARKGDLASSWVSTPIYIGPIPQFTAVSFTGQGTLKITWSITNAANLRPFSTFRIYVSSANSEFYYDKGFYGPSTREYETGLSGSGAELIEGGTYYIRVWLYDAGGNAFSIDRSVVFTRTRPANFNWDVAKTSNGAYNLTAKEWDGFLDKINSFRAYKKLAISTFNRSVTSGALPYVALTAASYNQARNSINSPGMNPTIAVPGQVSIGERINATHLNNIRASLNSIT